MATIVMTGGTSGFGAIAARRMQQSGDLIIGTRQATDVGQAFPLDLTDLESVHEFAGSVSSQLGGRPVDALVLNAGMILPDISDRTADGFETTFAVNHLAHYLVLRLLLPFLADGAIVVMTSSGTHDPATKAGLETPRHADARLLAHPELDPDVHNSPRKAGQHAYTASKLCTVLTARRLTQQPDARDRDLTIVAYDPGQVFGTGLARDLPFHLRMAWSVFGSPVLGWLPRTLSPTLNSITAAGDTLAELTLGVAAPPDSHNYAALRRDRLSWPDPSELARDDEVARQLWSDSARLVGLSDGRSGNEAAQR